MAVTTELVTEAVLAEVRCGSADPGILVPPTRSCSIEEVSLIHSASTGSTAPRRGCRVDGAAAATTLRVRGFNLFND